MARHDLFYIWPPYLSRSCDLYSVLESRMSSPRSRAIFPLGLPEEFSFVTTFRKRNTRRDPWFLVRVTDVAGSPQFGLSVDGRKNRLELYAQDVAGKRQVLRFMNVRVSTPRPTEFMYYIYRVGQTDRRLFE